MKRDKDSYSGGFLVLVTEKEAEEHLGFVNDFLKDL